MTQLGCRVIVPAARQQSSGPVLLLFYFINRDVIKHLLNKPGTVREQLRGLPILPHTQKAFRDPPPEQGQGGLRSQNRKEGIGKRGTAADLPFQTGIETFRIRTPQPA